MLHVHSSSISFFPHGLTAHNGQAYHHYRSFTITLRHNTLGRTQDGRPARRTDFYLITHKTHTRQTFTYSRGCELSIPKSAWLQTYTCDRAATWIASPDSYTPILLWDKSEISLSISERQYTSFFLYYQIQEYILLKRSILSEIYNKTFPKTNSKTFHSLWHSVKTLEIQ